MRVRNANFSLSVCGGVALLALAAACNQQPPAGAGPRGPAGGADRAGARQPRAGDARHSLSGVERDLLRAVGRPDQGQVGGQRSVDLAQPPEQQLRRVGSRVERRDRAVGSREPPRSSPGGCA